MERETRDSHARITQASSGDRWIREVDPKPFLESIKEPRVSTSLTLIKPFDKDPCCLLLVQEVHGPGEQAFQISCQQTDTGLNQPITAVKNSTVADAFAHGDSVFLALFEHHQHCLQVYYKKALVCRLSTRFKPLSPDRPQNNQYFLASGKCLYWLSLSGRISFLSLRPVEAVESHIRVEGKIHRFAVNRYDDSVCVVDSNRQLVLFGADRKTIGSAEYSTETGTTASCLAFVKLDWIMMCLNSSKHQSNEVRFFHRNGLKNIGDFKLRHLGSQITDIVFFKSGLTGFVNSSGAVVIEVHKIKLLPSSSPQVKSMFVDLVYTGLAALRNFHADSNSLYFLGNDHLEVLQYDLSLLNL